MELNKELADWLRFGDRGVSSNAIVETLEGWPNGTLSGHWLTTYPHDPADLRRCALLLRAVPGYRARIGELSAASPEWAALVAHWDELEALLAEEIGAELKPQLRYAPRTYKRMQELITETRKK